MHAAVALGASLLIADHASIPLDARCPNPERVGPDRLLNAYAADARYGAPADRRRPGDRDHASTPSTRGGAFVGGAIAPGIELGLRALASDAALLPHVFPGIPATAIGTDTSEAIRSGVVLGHVGVVRELVARMAQDSPRRAAAGHASLSPAASRPRRSGQALRGATRGRVCRDRRYPRPGPHVARPRPAPRRDRRGPGRAREPRSPDRVPTSRPLAGRLILLGVTGSIAAYKAAELVRLLIAAGADVQVLMTHSAAQFIGPLTLETLSRRRVMLDPLELLPDRRIGHIVAADSADAILVAPATARWLGAMANGLADDVITATCLATSAPVVVAPAMDGEMYAHPATRGNVERLRGFGYTIVEPEIGPLASGQTGQGRLAELPSPGRRGGPRRRRPADPRARPHRRGHRSTPPRRTGSRRLAHRGDRRRHRGTHRSGALHRQSLHRQDGRRHRRRRRSPAAPG